jgi:hypothetical protein
MANIMTTRFTIKNLNEETFEKLQSLMELNQNDNYSVDYIKNINILYEKEFTDEVIPDYEFMVENVGAKWITIEGIDKNYSDEVDVLIESAWSVPVGYLEKLAEYLTKLDENIILTGTYEDESMEPMGAFVYGHNFDDIEDLDVEIDHDRFWDDDEYRDEIYGDLYELRDNLYEGYLEVKQEREEDVKEENN